MTREQLEAIRQRAEAATPGPWGRDPLSHPVWDQNGDMVADMETVQSDAFAAGRRAGIETALLAAQRARESYEGPYLPGDERLAKFKAMDEFILELHRIAFELKEGNGG